MKIKSIVAIILTIGILLIIQYRSDLFTQKVYYYDFIFESISDEMECKVYYVSKINDIFNKNNVEAFYINYSEEYVENTVRIYTDKAIGKIRFDLGENFRVIKLRNIKLIGVNSVDIPIDVVAKGINKNTELINLTEEEITLSAKDVYPRFTMQNFGQTDANSETVVRYSELFIFSVIILGIIYLIVDFILANMSSSNKKSEVLLLTILGTLLVLPLLLVDNKTVDIEENRNLAKYPQFIENNVFNESFMSEYEVWFSDHFGLRDFAQSAYNTIDREILNDNIENSKAFMGKEDWLFYKGSYSIEQYQNLDSLYYTEKELAKIKNNIDIYDNWFKDQGIKLYIYVAPDKHRIYGEYYPDYYKKVNELTRLEQLQKYLSDNNSIEIISSYDSLTKGKEEGMMYYKAGSHWTEWGGLKGYQDIMEVVKKEFPEINILEDEKFTVEYNAKPEWSLANMLNIDYSKYDDYEYPSLVYNDNYTFEYIKNENVDGIITKNVRGKYSLVMFRDSFTTNMTPYLLQTFDKVDLIWEHDYNKYQDAIINRKPDIVIIETVERGLDRLLNNVPKLKEVN